MHQSSFDKMEKFRDQYLTGRKSESLNIMDLGSMDINGTYRRLFEEKFWRYTGLDLEPGENVDMVLKNPYKWSQIKSETVDVLISGQAFEHIEFFWITMLEIARILKPGGICCIIVPSNGTEHRYPVDCWRFYPDGCSALARFARLELLEAVTQWENAERYDELSNKWHDTVMVARKYKLAPFFHFRQRVWRWILHRVLIQRL